MPNPPHHRVAVAMSGGVDSSVAAALLCDAGWEVVGLTMRLGSSAGWEATHACCGLTELHDARRVADKLGIPHYVLNHAERFEAEVIADFVDEYARGRTPNPCIRCNQHIKFATFLDHARAFDCTHVATGHYARIHPNADTFRYELWRGADTAKDQSYVLHTLTQAQLAAALFPLGSFTKPMVRAVAAELDLPVADKPESQDLCFVAEGGYAQFVAERRPDAAIPGPILDRDGRLIGTHRGLVQYTVGQRHGLGVAGDAPLYVSEIRAPENALVVEPAATAGRRACRVSELMWVSHAPTDEPLRCLAMVRYRMMALPAVLEPAAGGAILTFDEPLRGISPGQSAVCYDEQGRVLAGGVIAEVRREAEALLPAGAAKG
ncbi:MAG: tRNA 2-thiouridine(34) synthase MnmA [Armatimonadetes bacterium]|nr:tRNA 2-thiouridine(34) synthase MnmA [Armatimonadota bacterium]